MNVIHLFRYFLNVHKGVTLLGCVAIEWVFLQNNKSFLDKLLILAESLEDDFFSCKWSVQKNVIELVFLNLIKHTVSKCSRCTHASDATKHISETKRIASFVGLKRKVIFCIQLDISFINHVECFTELTVVVDSIIMLILNFFKVFDNTPRYIIVKIV